jgi:DNA polymerase-1
MFFDDIPLTKRKKATLHALPEIPDTGWRPPSEFPNLSAATAIGLDCETKEPEFEMGPGWARGRGHIVGVSLAAQAAGGSRGKWYFPVRHEVERHDNLNPDNVFPWLKSVLETPVPKVGANLIYDLGWLTTENIYVGGPLHDVQFAEALIDEDALVSLDALGEKYLDQRKTTDVMYEWLRAAYPNTPKTQVRGDIFRAPPRLAGYYAEDDADLPLRLMTPMYTELMRQGLTDVYRLECDIIPLLIRMRLEGVSVNLAQAEEMQHTLRGEVSDLYGRIKSEYGYSISSTDSRQVGKLFDTVGIDVPRTDAGNYKVQKEWLSALEHPLGEIVRNIREREKLIGTFLQSYIIDKSIPVSGSNSLAKIYPQFHPLKGDSNGTKVGRFASSDPNLQNIPGRTALGKLLRTVFVPDLGHAFWAKYDYSQIHYRILAHFAVGPGADELRETYRKDKKADYHKTVQGRVLDLTGMHIDRKPVKNINFGLLYGLTQKKLAYTAGFDEGQAQGVFAAYFQGAPYVKPTMQMIADEVQANGFVRSVLGRRCRFNEWEPATRGTRGTPLPYDQAIRQYGSFIRRAYDYRGVNYKFQSSEPDIMKSGMRACLNAGVFDAVGVPRLTVHDELDFSVRDDTPETREAFEFIQHTMENTVKLRVPVFVDCERGPNWGDVKEVD